MRIFLILIIAFYCLSCDNKKNTEPVYTAPENSAPPQNERANNQRIIDLLNNYKQNKGQDNNYNSSSDYIYYCENCGEIINETEESEEYCEDCLLEMRNREEQDKEDEIEN